MEVQNGIQKYFRYEEQEIKSERMILNFIHIEHNMIWDFSSLGNEVLDTIG